MSFVGARVIVKGVVQGVGFRYWTLKKSRSYDVAGQVANLPDGTVEIIVEGDRGPVEDFLAEIKVGPTYGHVSDMLVNWYNSPKGYKDFIITHEG